MVTDDIELISSVTKRLYPELTRKYKTTPSRVERAIRHQLKLHGQGDKSKQFMIFLVIQLTLKGKPTNSEFIAMIADKMRWNIMLVKTLVQRY